MVAPWQGRCFTVSDTCCQHLKEPSCEGSSRSRYSRRFGLGRRHMPWPRIPDTPDDHDAGRRTARADGRTALQRSAHRGEQSAAASHAIVAVRRATRQSRRRWQIAAAPRWRRRPQRRRDAAAAIAAADRGTIEERRSRRAWRRRDPQLGRRSRFNARGPNRVVVAPRRPAVDRRQLLAVSTRLYLSRVSATTRGFATTTAGVPIRYAPWGWIYGTSAFARWGSATTLLRRTTGYGYYGPDPYYGYGQATLYSGYSGYYSSQPSTFDTGARSPDACGRAMRRCSSMAAYAGLVNDFDGVFQELRLSQGEPQDRSAHARLRDRRSSTSTSSLDERSISDRIYARYPKVPRCQCQRCQGVGAKAPRCQTCQRVGAWVLKSSSTKAPTPWHFGTRHIWHPESRRPLLVFLRRQCRHRDVVWVAACWSTGSASLRLSLPFTRI